VRELIIAIAKGRLQAEALELLSRAGICANGDSRESRRLAIRDESGQYKLLFVKPNDVPVYVEHGIADCGIVGRDVLLEFEPDVLQPLTLNIGRCQIIVAAPEAATPSASGMLTIATKHSHIAAKHFRSRGQPVEIIELSGSVELAPGLGLSDCIVDLVQTGTTLRDNGLKIVEVITDSMGRLIVNRASYQLKATSIATLIAALRQATDWGGAT